jgi:alpha-1,6-mannosyltransferase
MVGDGPLCAEVEAAALNNRSVQLLPYESDRVRFARLLASADLYVTAGPHETFGLSVIEAQASGLPVVGVDGGALRERVPRGLGYLGAVGDADEMACNILRAASERRAIGQRARTHVETHFSWSAAFRRLLSLYESAYSRELTRSSVSSGEAAYTLG